MEVDVTKMKALRQERVLSQRELATMAGLTQMTVEREEARLPGSLHGAHCWRPQASVCIRQDP
jgi:predicted transcriptional regulator